MDNKAYNDYLTSLFQNCSIQAFLKYGDRQISRTVDEMFSSLADAYNDILAAPYLSELEIKYPTLPEKLAGYPEMFWKTSKAENVIYKGLVKLAPNFLLDVYEKDKESKNYDGKKKEQHMTQMMEQEEEFFTALKKIGIELAEDKKNIHEIVTRVTPALHELVSMTIAFIDFEPEKMLYSRIKMHKIMDGENCANLSVDQNALNKILIEEIKSIFEKRNQNTPKEKFNM